MRHSRCRYTFAAPCSVALPAQDKGVRRTAAISGCVFVSGDLCATSLCSPTMFDCCWNKIRLLVLMFRKYVESIASATDAPCTPNNECVMFKCCTCSFPNPGTIQFVRRTLASITSGTLFKSSFICVSLNSILAAFVPLCATHAGKMCTSPYSVGMTALDKCVRRTAAAVL